MLLVLFVFFLFGELTSGCRRATPAPEGCVCPKIEQSSVVRTNDNIVGNLTIEESLDSSGCSSMTLQCRCPETRPAWIDGNCTWNLAFACGYTEVSTGPDFPIKCINGQWIDANANEPTIIYCECSEAFDDVAKCEEWVGSLINDK